MTGSRCCFSYSQSSDLSIHEVQQVGRFPNPKLFIELGHNTCGVFETNDLGGSADCRLLRLRPGQPRQGRRLWPHQKAQDGRGQVSGPGGAQEGGHERFPRQHEEDEEVSIT